MKRLKFSGLLGPKLSFAENQTVTCKANLTHLERRCLCEALRLGLNTVQKIKEKENVFIQNECFDPQQ